MKLLAIESSGMTAGAAVFCDGQITAAYDLTHRKTHSQTLLPMIDTVCRMAEIDKEELDAVAVSSGPGSFTGLRIGAATAKGIGLALSVPVVPVPTLEGMAYGVWGWSGLVCPMLDARRNTVYTGLYRVDGTVPEAVLPQQVREVDDLLADLKQRGDPLLFLGDGAELHAERIRTAFAEAVPKSRENGRGGKNTAGLPVQASERYAFAPPHRTRQSAASVAALGALYYEAGKAVAAEAFVPVYLRRTQAERERMERLQKKEQE